MLMLSKRDYQNLCFWQARNFYFHTLDPLKSNQSPALFKNYFLFISKCPQGRATLNTVFTSLGSSPGFWPRNSSLFCEELFYFCSLVLFHGKIGLNGLVLPCLEDRFVNNRTLKMGMNMCSIQKMLSVK